MSKDTIDFESLADSLLGMLVELHGVLYVISFLKQLGYTRAQIIALQFDSINVSEVFDQY